MLRYHVATQGLSRKARVYRAHQCAIMSQLLRLLVLGRGVDALLRQLGCTVTSCGGSPTPLQRRAPLEVPGSTMGTNSVQT